MACGKLWQTASWDGIYIPALDTPLDLNGDGTYDVFVTENGSYSGPYKNIAMITGSNLNPRAWALDLENGLLLQDPSGQLVAPFAEERQQILEHTRRLNHFSELERLVDYPEAVRRLLVRLQRFKAHLLLKQLL